MVSQIRNTMTDKDTDKDHVFSRFQDGPSASTERREQRIIPRRGGALGSQVVEVVHVRSGGALRADKKPPSRTGFGVRAATWEDGFPTREAVRDSAPTDLPKTTPAQQNAHVMPMWERRGTPEESRPSDRAPARSAKRATASTNVLRKSTAQRRVADPFDAHDDGANCLRCGYVIEPERDRRDLMTCAACG
jgi:hypothetical protein